MSRNRRRRLRLLVPALCAAALLAAGCGGSDYRSKVEDAVKQFKTSSEQAGRTLGSAKNKKTYGKGVAQFQAAVKTLSGKLQKLNPPSGAKAAQSRLISVLNAFSTDIGSMRDAYNRNDIEKMQKLQGKLVSDIGAVQSAGKELDNKAH